MSKSTVSGGCWFKSLFEAYISEETLGCARARSCIPPLGLPAITTAAAPDLVKAKRFPQRSMLSSESLQEAKMHPDLFPPTAPPTRATTPGRSRAGWGIARSPAPRSTRRWRQTGSRISGGDSHWLARDCSNDPRRRDWRSSAECGLCYGHALDPVTPAPRVSCAGRTRIR
jgi:hypothetical protein